MSEICRRIGNRRIGWLKIDIEGAEKEVFANSAARWLERVDALSIELHDAIVPGCALAVYRAIARRPFTKFNSGQTETFLFRRSSNRVR